MMLGLGGLAAPDAGKAGAGAYSDSPLSFFVLRSMQKAAAIADSDGARKMKCAVSLFGLSRVRLSLELTMFHNVPCSMFLVQFECWKRAFFEGAAVALLLFAAKSPVLSRSAFAI